MKSVTRTLASYVAKSKFSDLPNEVVEESKKCILDGIGTALGGYLTPQGKIAIDLIRDLGGKPESTVIGSGEKTSCSNAAFANSIMANALDYCDTVANVGHIGSAAIPAALAVAEKVAANGKILITAVTMGYEVASRIAIAMNRACSKERFSKVWGMSFVIFGPVCAAGKILNLNEDQMLDAFGIAGPFAPIPSIWKMGFFERKTIPLSWVKFPFALTARDGILAALLAQRGFVGMHTILDGERGFWMMAGSDGCDFDRMTEALGEKYEILQNTYKPYSSCRWTHTTLDAVYDLLHEYKFTAEEVEKIVVNLPTMFTEKYMDFVVYEPRTLVDGQFSFPYTIAVALSGHETGLDWYTNERLKDPKILGLARRVEVKADPNADAMYERVKNVLSTVEITLKDGRRFRKQVSTPTGDPEKPFDLKEKFIKMARRVLGKDRYEQIIKTVDALEDLENVAELTKLLGVR